MVYIILAAGIALMVYSIMGLYKEPPVERQIERQEEKFDNLMSGTLLLKRLDDIEEKIDNLYDALYMEDNKGITGMEYEIPAHDENEYIADNSGEQKSEEFQQIVIDTGQHEESEEVEDKQTPNINDEIFALSDSGLSPGEIAQKLGMVKGEVLLRLGMRR